MSAVVKPPSLIKAGLNFIISFIPLHNLIETESDPHDHHTGTGAVLFTEASGMSELYPRCGIIKPLL